MINVIPVIAECKYTILSFVFYFSVCSLSPFIAFFFLASYGLTIFLKFLFIQLFIYLANLGLHWRVGCSLVAVSRDYFLLEVHKFLSAVASLLLQRTGSSMFGHQQLWHVGSAVVAPGFQRTGSVVVHRLCCPAACGIFPDQGSNLCLLHWQADFLPLDHLGSLD